MVTYSHNQMVGFRKKRGQNLVKVGQTLSNLIDGPDTTGLGEIYIQILINRIEEYSDILMLVKFKTNLIVKLSKHYHTSTQRISIMCHT